jgi:hypothetical protein
MVADVYSLLSDNYTAAREDKTEKYSRPFAVAYSDKRLFIIQQGRMGLCRPQAIAGDEIVCFPTGLYPFVLRRLEDG